MADSFGNQAAESDVPMQFLETENNNIAIQNPDRKGLVHRFALGRGLGFSLTQIPISDPDYQWNPHIAASAQWKMY